MLTELGVARMVAHDFVLCMHTLNCRMHMYIL